MNTSNIKAVVFDMDGTLLDTSKDIAAVVNGGLATVGIPPYPVEKFPDVIGHGIRTLFRTACPDTITDQQFEDALAVYLKEYPEKCTVYTTFYEGIQDLLAKLEQEGIAIAILSNKTEVTAKKIANHYMEDVPFKFVWGNNGSRPLKPATDAGALICKELNLKPEEIVFFGDGDTDMEFGSKCGFFTVGCTWGYRSPEVLTQYGAHHLVDTVQEFIELLGL